VWTFENRIGEAGAKALFDGVSAQLLQQGFIARGGQIIDATLVPAPRVFANDYENLLVVHDATNQAKSDKAPHEWLPPMKSFWCEYGKHWERIKDKYGLRFSSEERLALNKLAKTCEQHT